VYMTVLEVHHVVASRWYDFSSNIRPMYRMRFADPEAALKETQLPARFSVHALGADDVQRIRRLYAYGGEFAPDAFDAYQAADGTFFGAADANGELLAVGGTHVVDWQEGIAAIGNMYTHPAHRSEGLGSAVLQAIVKRLLDGGATHIVLNVDERNPVARRLYEQHGFEIHCRYLEGRGRRMDPK
jgi:ribosomal protein S18 acetylase RimI-like enzyme